MNTESELVRMLCDQRQLQTQIKEVQSRLGTAAELPDDLDRVRAIAHQLNNILTVIRFRHIE